MIPVERFFKALGHSVVERLRQQPLDGGSLLGLKQKTLHKHHIKAPHLRPVLLTIVSHNKECLLGSTFLHLNNTILAYTYCWYHQEAIILKCKFVSKHFSIRQHLYSKIYRLSYLLKGQSYSKFLSHKINLNK